MSKYNFDLDIESRNSLSLIIERMKPNSMVLEFGPANGRMTKYLKEQMGCKVYTVELDPEAAQDASKFSEEIVVGNIEEYAWLQQYSNFSFDYIVFADVLEHLYNPEEVLKKAKTLLKEDGSVLISLPNIAHNSIIIELLDNRFTYHDTGLLDNTHIRFFTKKSIDDFIKQCGLQIAYETASFAKPEETEFGNSYDDVDDSVAATLFSHEYGEVYQFIIETKKKITTKIVDLDKKESALLFYDTGQGFNDHEMRQTLYSYKSDKKIQFVLEKPIENVKSIRIDPLEYPLKIKLSKIIIDEKVVGFEQVNHNGVMHKENTLTFSHFDPQIIVKMKEERKVQKVELYYDFISDVRDVKLLSLEEKELQIQNLHKTISQLEELAESMRIKNRIKNILPFFLKNRDNS